MCGATLGLKLKSKQYNGLRYQMVNAELFVLSVCLDITKNSLFIIVTSDLEELKSRIFGSEMAKW